MQSQLRTCSWMFLACLVVFGCGDPLHKDEDAAAAQDSRTDDGPADTSIDRSDPADATTADATHATTDASDATADSSDAIADAPDATTDASDASPVFIASPKSVCTLCGEGMKFCGTYCATKQDPNFGCGGESCNACHFAHALAKCGADGMCAFDRCWPGWGDCNDDLSDGCESALDQMNNCGACGVACQSSQLCGASGCVDYCDFPLTTCHGFQCADLASELHSCGSCGMTLTPVTPRGESTCKDGKLSFSCDPGLTVCSIDECVDTRTDLKNCGACDKECYQEYDKNTLFPIWAKVPRCENGTCIRTCVLDQCGAQCTELFSDRSNCGRCGKMCGDQICYQGQCHPPTFNELGRAGEAPAAWAADRDAFYWTEANRIMRFSRSSNSVDELVANAYGPTSIAVDDCYIYWVASLGSVILRQEKTPGAVFNTLARTQNKASALTQDATHIYWLEANTPPTVRRSPKVPSPPASDGQILVADAAIETASGLVVDDTSVYYVAGYDRSANVQKAAKDGSAPASHIYLASQFNLGLSGANETTLYASYSPQSGSDTRTLIEIPKDGTSPTVRDTWRASLLYPIIEDGANLYAATGKDIVLVPKCANGKATRLIETTTRKLLLDRGLIYYFDGASLRSVVAPGTASTSSTLPLGTCPTGPVTP